MAASGKEPGGLLVQYVRVAMLVNGPKSGSSYVSVIVLALHGLGRDLLSGRDPAHHPCGPVCLGRPHNSLGYCPPAPEATP